MTPSSPKRNGFAPVGIGPVRSEFGRRLATVRSVAVVGACVLGLLLVPLGRHPAVASTPPELGSQPRGRAAAVTLRLTPGAATRVLAELSGAAQESDAEKPKSMEEQTAPPPVAAGSAARAKKEAVPPDQFAFLKDWPFWVIVGGVVVAGVGGYMLLRNSNQTAPCAPQFTAGCFP